MNEFKQMLMETRRNIFIYFIPNYKSCLLPSHQEVHKASQILDLDYCTGVMAHDLDSDENIYNLEFKQQPRDIFKFLVDVYNNNEFEITDSTTRVNLYGFHIKNICKQLQQWYQLSELGSDMNGVLNVPVKFVHHDLVDIFIDNAIVTAEDRFNFGAKFMADVLLDAPELNKDIKIRAIEVTTKLTGK